jgi:hypothetical protein
MHKAAKFSDDKKYRYTLERIWDGNEKLALFVMLNPSKADDKHGDRTIWRCKTIAQQLGFSGILVANLYAFVQTDGFLENLKAIYRLDNGARFVSEDGSSRNDKSLEELQRSAHTTIVAWGDDGAEKCVRGRKDKVLRLLKDPLFTLGCPTRKGEPRHPSRLPRREEYLLEYRR